MAKNVLSRTSDLKIFFNKKYDSKNKTIDAKSAEYIMRNVFQLIEEIKDAKGSRFYKMIAKRQLQSIGLKTELATKTYKNGG